MFCPLNRVKTEYRIPRLYHLLCRSSETTDDSGVDRGGIALCVLPRESRGLERQAEARNHQRTPLTLGAGIASEEEWRRRPAPVLPAPSASDLPNKRRQDAPVCVPQALLQEGAPDTQKGARRIVIQDAALPATQAKELARVARSCPATSARCRAHSNKARQ